MKLIVETETIWHLGGDASAAVLMAYLDECPSATQVEICARLMMSPYRYRAAMTKIEGYRQLRGMPPVVKPAPEPVTAPAAETAKKPAKSEPSKIPEAKRKAYDAEFDSIWVLYPRKVGVKAAREAYARARRDGATYEEILNGVRQYAQLVTETDARFIAHGSTWFRGRRWEDDYSDAVTEQQPAEEPPQNAEEYWPF